MMDAGKSHELPDIYQVGEVRYQQAQQQGTNTGD